MQLKNKSLQVEDQNSDNQNFNSLSSSWADLLNFSLAFDGRTIFEDASKLRMFATNCLESYLEYGMIKNLELNELKSILYYFGKKYESENAPPVGKELQFLHLVFSKINKGS